MSPRTTDLVSGVAMTGAFLLLAWVIAIGPEDRKPAANRLYARMRTRQGRRVVAALIVVMALAILVLHIVKFQAE
jgi:hypothetical protein